MAITYDPGTDKALEQISGAVANIAQPYKAQEQALRSLMTKDPALAQKLADLAYTNPGSIASFAGPNAETYFQTLHPSSGAKADVAVRPAVTKVLDDPNIQKIIATKETAGITPGAARQDLLTGKIADVTGQQLSESPDLQTGTAYRRLTGTGAGTAAKQMQEFRFQQAYPKVQQLQAENQLIPEFDKFITGQASRFDADMLNSAMDSPLGALLRTRYAQMEADSRAAVMAASRGGTQDKNFQYNMDKLIVAKALDVKSKTGKAATVGDIIYMMSGRQDLADKYGGTTPEGLEAAQQAFNDNDDLRNKDAQATTLIGRFIKSLSTPGMPMTAKQAVLDQINTEASHLRVPIIYSLNDNGELIQLGANLTPTGTGHNNPPNVPQPSTGPASSGSGSSHSTSGGQQVKVTGGTPPVAKESPNYANALKAAPDYTVEEIKADPVYKTLTPSEQKNVIKKAKKSNG